MADYYSPTVVTPELPVCDVTPLERLILGRVFDVPGQRDGLLYFSAPYRPEECFKASRRDLQAALEDSKGAESRLNDVVAAVLASQRPEASGEPASDLQIDLTAAELDWSHILQDIVRRSGSLDEVVVWTAFTCTSMCQDGFGGSVMRITAEAIQYASMPDMLERMRDETLPVAALDGSNLETRRRIEAVAGAAAWDSYTLVVIARWLHQEGHIEHLIEFLDGLVADEDA